MIVHKCDNCGKEMRMWLESKIKIGAMNPETNIGPWIYLEGTKEYCLDCFMGLCV